jgi:addiction module HigA family antidote
LTITVEDTIMKREVLLVHPGEILLEDWLEPLGISQYALAKAIDVPRRRINEIVKGQRAISVDTAMRLGVFFGVDPEGWLALQAHYDTEMLKERLQSELQTIPRYNQLAKHQETVAKPSNQSS